MAAFKLRDKRVFKLEIMLCLAWARLLVACLPFRWWRSVLGPLDGEPPQLDARQLKKAVDTGRIVREVAERMPFAAVCLPQAMATRWMLARRGIGTRLRIGARRGEQLGSAMLVHAWLCAGDRVVTGKHERDSYTAFCASASNAGME